MLTRARNGDFDAFIEADIFGLCVGFSENGIYLDINKANRPDQRAAIQRVMPFCKLINSSNYINQLNKIETDLLHQENPGVIADHLMKPDSTVQSADATPEKLSAWIWSEAQKNPSPETTRELLNTLFNSQHRLATKIPVTLGILNQFNEHPAFLSSGPYRQQEVRSLALDVLACRRGGNCAPYGNIQESYCIYRGACASHLRLDAFIEQHLVNTLERQWSNS